MKHLIILILLPLLQAFTVLPMSHTIELADGQKEAQFLLDNASLDAMAIEISVKGRIQKEDGTEDNPVTNDLEAFPPQLIIPPKEKRTVRVRWKGKAPKDELAFRMIAEQLPLEVDKKKKQKGGIKMMLKYVAALYVNPGNTSAKIEVIEIKNDKQLELLVKNHGNLHRPFQNFTLTLTNGKKTIELKAEQLIKLQGENILAGATRRFILPPVSGVDSSFKGIFKFE